VCVFTTRVHGKHITIVNSLQLRTTLNILFCWTETHRLGFTLGVNPNNCSPNVTICCVVLTKTIHSYADS